MGGKEDKTNYVIRNENKSKASANAFSIATSSSVTTEQKDSNGGSNTKKESTTFESLK